LSPPSDVFATSVNSSCKATVVNRAAKPYCHGGAALMMQSKRFPQAGLPESGLGGISLGVLLIDSLEEAWRARLADGQWYLRNDPALAVQHPRKANLLQWTVTYLGYTKAWSAVLDMLTPSSAALWQTRLQAGRKARFEALLASANSGADWVGVLGNILLTRYYKPLLPQHLNYADFAGVGVRLHSNL